MKLEIDENEQQHIYSCLLVGANEFGKVKKSLAKLDREDPEIDEQIQLNSRLKRIFNPRAEEEARAKRDDAQLDLTEVPSSGETGGGIPAGQTFKLNTGEQKSIAQLRDELLEFGIAISLDAFGEYFTTADFDAANSWVDAARTAVANGDPQPDLPEALDAHSMPVSRFQELLTAGPWGVREHTVEDAQPDDPDMEIEFHVIRESSDSGDGLDQFDSAYDSKLDAEIRAAWLNRTELQRADMSDEEVIEWAGKGPWTPMEGNGDQPAFVFAGTQREDCESFHDAHGRAARYNRSIAERHVEPMYEVVDEQNAEASVEQEVDIVAVAGADQAD